MKLSTALRSDFGSGTRLRGASYFLSGSVRIEHGSGVEVRARVRGSRWYEVEISWDEKDGLALACDCPFFESSGPCKHLWATILKAESDGHLMAVSFNGKREYDYSAEEDIFNFDDRGLELPPRGPARTPARIPKEPEWRQSLDAIAAPRPYPVETWPARRQLLYAVDVQASSESGGLILNLLAREPKRNGEWKKAAAPRLVRGTIGSLPDPADRRILGLLAGSDSFYMSWNSVSASEPISNTWRVVAPLASEVLPLIAAAGRGMLQLQRGSAEMQPFTWDDGGPWRFQLRLRREGRNRCALAGILRRGEEEMDLSAPVLVTQGLVFTHDRVAPLDEGAAAEWIRHLRRSGPIHAPETDARKLLAAALEHPLAAPLEVPEEWRYQELRPAPRPSLVVRAAPRDPWNSERLRAQLWFDYEGRRVPQGAPGHGIYDPEARTFLVRDAAAESAAQERLRELGLTPAPTYGRQVEPAWDLAPKKLPALARACLEASWHIEAEGKIFRRAAAVRVEVSSGVDWFELHGEADYGESTATLPALLAALRRGDNMVQLDDGSYGLLPEEWLSRFASFAALGIADEDHIRFRRNQAGLLDALLASQPEACCDATFARVRDELRSFQGIRAAAQPAGFCGQLRDYQREGLGWMEFLRRFGFGGCLADDMGVGKTAQVLALLETRRVLRECGEPGPDAPAGPSLAVVPKSLVFNWKQEAARFTPRLRVLDHTGLARNVRDFAAYDLVLTTYGTLRRDALEFKDLEFDYVVLDEAQAIKNAGSESAKAVRLLRGRHRLALSGTPVENHLGELWSLFEFLNPGMLGSASVFKMAGGAARNPSEETRALLAHALRPFLLRRTKEQVARELPAKSEQTVFCELEPPQRKLYDELRAHYRRSLLGIIERQGLAKSKIQVLEALLRLRQAACHPGLLDPKRFGDPSAKLDMLMEHLGDVVEEGHKALVFSQFTSLLAIVRDRLDATGMRYEYLDGATRNRQECVERFQNDSTCPLFLISLKAGGLGLNLTAAEYVFLLDPWWNPAVEAQAVDRAHRIGQTRQVFAYRLIARDTVEEKVLELQSTKRDLAAAIISADNTPLRNLQREDLELLLS
ncbi:MAG TPA: DEAD/DEAH box helicase [Bryobacteraceae bacterium]|nr:DEAD/DEAH box helicase [Bryobacteraceae bacterium]